MRIPVEARARRETDPATGWWADYSDTGVHFDDEPLRYSLGRVFGEGPRLAVISLNPSKANHLKNDATISRDIKFAKRWGFGSLVKPNLFAFRATDPRKMKVAADPIGPLNDRAIEAAVRSSARVIVAWGTSGAFLDRDLAVLALLRRLGVAVYCLGVTQDGFPKHPVARGKHAIPVNVVPSRYEGRGSLFVPDPGFAVRVGMGLESGNACSNFHEGPSKAP